MTVIIAEKPSLARNISSAVGGMSRRDGFFEGNGYIVTWAFGHLFTLADIEEYNPRPEGEKHWTLKNLPCFPSEYRFELKKDKNGKQDDGVKKQFEIIRALCCRDDTDIIVNENRVMFASEFKKYNESFLKRLQSAMQSQYYSFINLGRAMSAPAVIACSMFCDFFF